MEPTRVIVSDVYVVNEGSKEETRILGETVFGRVEVDKNYPTDTLISRRHFRLIPVEEAVLIEDLGSTNRTRVNGKILKPNTLYKLRSRDLIEFGQQKLRIFVGGKILGDATRMITKGVASPEQEAEQSLVFERIVSGESGDSAQSMRPEGLVKGADGMELDGYSGTILPGSRDDALLKSLVTKKNAAWYLQFGGSEFGPLSLKELRVVVRSQQFQGGALFVFTEGLSEWLPVDKILSYLDEPQREFTATQRMGGGVPLGGKAVCHVRTGKTLSFPGRIEAVSLAELTVSLREPLLTDAKLLELEVEPEASSGIESFRATAKVDPARSFKTTYVFLLVQAPPRAKMSIERYVRSME